MTFNIINKMNKSFEKFLDQPHEKIYFNLINEFLFSLIYYYIYLMDPNCFIVNELMFINRKEQKLEYTDFLYYSTLLNFTISFGDMIPLTGNVKFLSSLQVFIFWYIALLLQMTGRNI